MPTPIGYTRDPDGLLRFHFDDGAKVPAAGDYAERFAADLPDLGALPPAGPSMASRGVAAAPVAPPAQPVARDFGDVDAVPVDYGDVDAPPRDLGSMDDGPRTYTGRDFTGPGSTVPASMVRAAPPPAAGAAPAPPMGAPVMATGAAPGQPGATSRGPSTVDLVDQDMLAQQRAARGGGGVLPAHEVDVVSPVRASEYIRASTDVANAQAREADARATADYAQAGAIQTATQEAEMRHLAERVRAAADARDRQAAEDEIKAAHAVKVNPNQWWESKTTGGQVMAALALGMGALGAAFSKSERNPALEIIQGAIQDDIAAQRQNIALGADGAKGRLAAIERRVGDHRAADAAAEALAWQTVDHQIASLQAGAEGSAAAAQGDALRAAAAQKQQEAWMRFKQWVPARSTGSGAPSLDKYLERRKKAADIDKAIAEKGGAGGERKTPTERLDTALMDAGVVDAYQQADALEQALNADTSTAGNWDVRRAPAWTIDTATQRTRSAALAAAAAFQTATLGKSDKDAEIAQDIILGDGSESHLRVGIDKLRSAAKAKEDAIRRGFYPDTLAEYDARRNAQRRPPPKVAK